MRDQILSGFSWSDNQSVGRQFRAATAGIPLQADLKVPQKFPFPLFGDKLCLFFIPTSDKDVFSLLSTNDSLIPFFFDKEVKLILAHYFELNSRETKRIFERKIGILKGTDNEREEFQYFSVYLLKNHSNDEKLFNCTVKSRLSIYFYGLDNYTRYILEYIYTLEGIYT